MSSPQDARPAPSRGGLLLETVSASARELLTAPSVFEALPRVLSQVAKVVRIDRVVMVEMLPRSDGLSSHTMLFNWESPDNSTPTLSPAMLRDRDGDAALAEWTWPLSQGTPVVTVRRNAPPLVRDFLTQLGVMTSLMVPIMVDGRHWGQIGFDDCHSEHDWAGDDIKILTMLADVAGAAITRERFLGQAQRREALLQAINDSATEIMTATDLNFSVSRALGAVARAIDADRMLVMEVIPAHGGEPSRRALRNFWNAPDAPMMLSHVVRTTANPSHPDVAAWMAPLVNAQAVQAHRSTATPGVRALLERFQAHSALIVPILVDGVYWGHVGLDVCKRERGWTTDEIDVLRTLAELIGTATTRERHLQALATANTIIQNSPTILWRLRGEPTLPMSYISQNVNLFGYNPDELMDHPTRYRELIHAEDRDTVQRALIELLHKTAPAATIEFRLLTRDGATRWVQNHCTPVRDTDGRLIEIEGIMSDITDRKAVDEHIATLARTDPLTGLANRMTFHERLRQSYLAAERGAHPFAVLYLDLDRFKEVNDTMGHHAGDRLLQQVARRIEGATRSIDLAARLGGDEFAIVQTELVDSASAGTLAEKLIEIISAPYVLDGNELSIGVSIGISSYGPESAGPDALLAQADQALYRAKHSGRGQYRFHSDEIDHETRSHLALAEDLRAALSRGELEIRYQPQVELATGKIVGMEALLRWNHPTRGTLLPEDFLPIAEKFGLMQQLGRWILDGACRQMSLWRRENMSVRVVAINIALAQIKLGREFVRDVVETIARWDLKPSDIELDVTESVLARTTLAQSRVLEELNRLGVGIAIDDFGAQYSSLDYLRTYHVNRLKIARGMVAAADIEPGGSAMIRAILSLAAALNVEVVAEGVETEAQRLLLVEAGERTQGQGFYYSRAVSAEESTIMLRTGNMRAEFDFDALELPPDDPPEDDGRQR